MKFLVILLMLLPIISCSKKEKIQGVAFEEVKDWKAKSPLEELGYHLYFDKRLSEDNTLSCNTCHDVTFKRGGVDGMATSTGIRGQKGGRNSPTVWNAKFLSAQFWDGRAKDLAEQAKGPITNPIEMGMESHEITIEKIEKIIGYQALFKKAFPENAKPINIDNLARAIAAFEETLVSLNSPYDRFKAGDKRALTSLAKRGMDNFQSIGCVACHSGDHFAGPKLQVGVGFYMKFPTFRSPELDEKYSFTKDLGRYEVTKKDADKNMWRVPTLRNVAMTSPYFHNGSVETLEEAVKVMGKTQLNKDLNADEIKTLVAFLNALTGKLPLIKEPTPLK